jgi:hypothetical protein
MLGTYLLQQATFGSLTFDLDVKNVISGRIKVPVDSSLSPDSKKYIGFYSERLTSYSYKCSHPNR